MDNRRSFFMSNETSAGEAAAFLRSDEVSAELRHSTPVKKRNDGSRLDLSQTSGLTGFQMHAMADQCIAGTSSIPADSRCPRSLQETESPVKDLSGSTILKQRRELQLLMTELKDRERELNAMAASHHQQRQAWERDHQRALALEQRCACLDEELQKRNEVIRILTRHVWMIESREKQLQEQLSEAKQKLGELEKKQQDVGEKCQDYEEKNQSLSCTITSLSSQVGALQVREEELSSLLALKDKDVTEASSRIRDLSGRVRDLEAALKESCSQGDRFLRDVEESKRRYKEARRDASQLKEELQQQMTQSSTQREEIIRLKQELQLLHRDLVLTGDSEGWKDELLELSRSKQDRIMSELHCLRQVCESQRKDLQLLRLNQESKTCQGLHGSRQDEQMSTCVHHSPSLLREKSFRSVHDLLQGAAGEPGILADVGAAFQSHTSEAPPKAFLHHTSNLPNSHVDGYI